MNTKVKAIVTRRTTYAFGDEATEQMRWVGSVLERTGLNQRELANKLHMTRQSISALLHDRAKMSFVTVFTICKQCGLDDDPEEVYKRISN